MRERERVRERERERERERKRERLQKDVSEALLRKYRNNKQIVLNIPRETKLHSSSSN